MKCLLEAWVDVDCCQDPNVISTVVRNSQSCG